LDYVNLFINDVTKHRTAHHLAHRTTRKRERQVTGRFAPPSVHPLDDLIGFLLIQLKPT